MKKKHSEMHQDGRSASQRGSRQAGDMTPTSEGNWNLKAASSRCSAVLKDTDQIIQINTFTVSVFFFFN